VSEYILELSGITKIFPGVRALNQVHFQLKAGQIHALMGENGAGKSTFIKIITGCISRMKVRFFSEASL
jgi:rhamnose transport system ATP-binding protein